MAKWKNMYFRICLNGSHRPQGQLQRSRLGLDKEPSLYDLYKDTSQVKKLEQEAHDAGKNLRPNSNITWRGNDMYVNGVNTSYTIPDRDSLLKDISPENITRSNAGFMYSLAAEERYEPWALRYYAIVSLGVSSSG